MRRHYLRRKARRLRKPKLRRPHDSRSATERFRALLTSFWGVIVGASVLMSIVGAIYSFSTKITISPETTLSPSDPFRTAFVISNDSYLPMSDVTFSCEASNIQPSQFVDEAPRGSKGRIPRLEGWSIEPGPGYRTDTLGPYEKRTFECLSAAMLLKHQLTSASIEIVVTYRPLWILWKQERRAKFNTERDKDGQLMWLPPRHY